MKWIKGSLLAGAVYLSAVGVCHAQPEAQVPAAVPVAEPKAAPAAEDSSEFISLDFKEADINTVLRVMSMKSGVNIVAGPDVKGTVTIRLENVPWQKALEVVLRTYDYVYEREDNIIRVTTREKMAQEPVTTQTYILNYTKAQEIMEAVKDMLSDRGRIKTADRTNALVITDIPTNLYRIGMIIKDLDKVTPQAYIDSKIVKTDVGTAETVGINWNAQASVKGSVRPTTFPFPTGVDPGGNNHTISPLVDQFFPTWGIAGNTNPDNRDFPSYNAFTAPGTDPFKYGSIDFSTFTAMMKMLQTRSNVKVVSNPRIVVLNNQKAKVQVGEQIPVPTFERNTQTGKMEVTGYNFRDVGVVLNVTPHINSEEEILVELDPEVSANPGNKNFGDFQAPYFTVTNAKTQVLIRSGQTIAIGGLMTDAVAMDEAKVPYLGDLPVVGKLFRSKTQGADSSNKKVETLFFITVTTVDTEGQPLVSQRSLPVPVSAQADPAAVASGNKQVQTNQDAKTSASGAPSPNAEPKQERTENPA
ncbi:MAG: secretin N-terminal domain-containing protein [Candidatus Omnitrophota bacterium]